MPKSIYVPEAGKVLNFSDDLSPSEISSYISAKYPSAQTGGGVSSLPAGPDNSSFLDRAAYSLGTMFTDVPGGIAALMYPASREEETWGGRFSKYWREQGAKNTNIDPTKEPTTTQNLGSAVGSAIGFLIPGGIATKGARLAGAGARLATGVGTGVVAGQGVAIGSEQRAEQIRQQLASGMNISEEQQLAAQRLSGLIGASEALPMHKFFGPLETIFSKIPASKAGIVEKIINNRLAKVAKAGAQEAAQEVAAGIANDLMEYKVYNPDVQVGQDLLSNAAGGAFVGSGIEGIIQLAAGRKLRATRQLQADIKEEQQKATQEMRSGLIAQAADDLRRTNIQGDVVAEEFETPEGWAAVRLRGPDGKVVAELPSLSEAQSVLDVYNQQTGSKVNLIQPQALKLQPIRVAGRSFKSPEAIVKEHERVKGMLKVLQSYKDNVPMLEREAARRGVPKIALERQIDASIAKHQADLTKFETFFSSGATEPEAAPITVKKPGETEQPQPVGAVEEVVAPDVAPVEEAAVAPSEPEFEGISIPETPRTVDEIASEPSVDDTEPMDEVPPDVMSEEMPIGAIEMPVQEDRSGIAAIDTEFVPEANIEPAQTKTVMRPSATDEQLTELKKELFGKPLGMREMTPEQLAEYEKERDARFPPVPVDVYNSMMPVDGIPKTLSEAELTGPYLKDLSPETQKWMTSVYNKLVVRLNGISPDVALRLKTLVDRDPTRLVRGQATATPDGLKSIIDLSTGILKPGMTVDEAVEALVETLNHEVIHALRDSGLFRSAEWGMLSRAAASAKVPGKMYTYLDKAQAIYAPVDENGIPKPISPTYADPDAVVEEAVAEMYRDWARGIRNPDQSTPAPTGIRGLLNRMTEFFRRIFRTFRDSQYEDFFKKIEAGEMLTREAGPRRTMPQKSGARFSATPVGSPGAPMSNDLNDRADRAFKLYPYLRSSAPRYYDHNRLILGDTNPGNAATQISNLDDLMARHPNTLASNQAFADYLADAMGKLATPQTGVPIVPYAAVMYANNPNMIARQLERMTPGQLAMAEEGLKAAKDFEAAYRSGTATPVHTAKLILWGILSRGVSPFVQESMFLDVVKPVGISNRTGMAQGGIDQFIYDAVNGEFDLNAYMDYVRTLKVDGLPGAGTTYNLGAFGKTTLVKLQQRVPDGRTILQYLHDLINDYSLSGKEIRRRFHEVNPGIGINNKVLSFMMLVSGRDDVLVLDRVQMRNQFNDGRFDEYNLYDGEKIEKEVTKKDGTTKLDNVTDPGTGIAHIGDGVFGLMYYEALERDLAKSIRQAYNMLGRGNQFSMGRYHWESWVATSSQEVDHGSVTGLIKEATGEENPYGGIYTGEGKYDTFNSGIRYGYTREGEAYVALPDGLGRYYFFTPEYAKKVIKGYAKRSTGIISDATFKVSESTEGPWYDRPEVNKERLRQYLRAQTELFKNERRLALSKRVSEIGQNNPDGSGPGPVHSVRRRGGVRQPIYTHPKKATSGVRFSASPALDSEEFKRWFSGSVAINPDGSPKVYYHGTPFSFDKFGKARSGAHKSLGAGPFFFSETSKFANDYAMTKMHKGGYGAPVKSGGRVIPVYLSVKNPFDYESPEDIETMARAMAVRRNLPDDTVDKFVSDWQKSLLDGFWQEMERTDVQEAIKDSGFDGFYLNENGFKNLAVFKPQQVKSIFNTFETGAAESPRFSAVPLPDYIQQQNTQMFAPVVKRSAKDSIFDFFFGTHPQDKVLNTIHGQVTLSDTKMKLLHGKANITDKGAMITELESQLNKIQSGNYQRFNADYSATVAMAQRRRASHLTASMILRGNMEINFARPGDIQSATMKVIDDQDSLKNIFNVLYQEGPIDPATGKPGDKREIFRTYAVAKRGEWLRATGQTVPAQLTPQYIQTAKSFTEREYPEVVEAYNAYQRFNKKLLTAAMHSGVISQAELARLTNQMNYYGFIYEVYGEPLGPQSSQKTASKFKLRAYTGSVRGGLASDPTFVMLQNAQFWVDSMAKNLAATKAFEVARQMGEARLLGTSESPDESRGEEPDIMYFSQNGNVKRFAVKDPLLVTALGADDRADLGRFWELMGLPSRLLRESVTRDPGFMIANLVRDTLSSWITSGADITPFIGTLKGGVTALRNGASYKALGSYGAVGSYDLAMLGPAELAATLRRKGMPLNVHTVGTREGMLAAMDSFWNRLGNLSEASDAATRIAVYDAAIAKGASEAEAAAQAVEILDFTRRGGSQALGILTKLIPFLNARIQGLDVLYQAGKAGYRYATGQSVGERDANLGKKFLVRGGMLAVISLVLEMMNHDDDDYKQLDDYIKNGNLLIPLKHFGMPGQFMAIPKPFEAGLLFSTIPQQFYKTAAGDATARENIALFTSQLGSTFGVNPIPQALLPAIEIITNHDFYTGLPLIPEGKARLSPELQYNSSTSQLAMLIGSLPIKYNMDTGRFEGISPIIIDNLIGGYGGPLGTYLVEGVSLAMEDFDVGPERMPREISKLPVVKRFFIDAATKNPKAATQAYELFRIVDEANRSYSRLRQTGDAEAVMDYLKVHKDELTYKKYVFKLVDRLNKLSAYERSVERNGEMSREDKIAAQRNIREMKIKLASQVEEINKKLGR